MARNGTEQRSVVVRQDPHRRRRQLVYGLLVVLAVALLAYWLGASLTRQALQVASSQRDNLAAELEQTRRERVELQQQLANLQIGSEVDRQALEDIRQLVKTQQQTITDLREEISFYKGLMAPTERERGVGVRSWELYPGSAPRQYQFKLTVQQLAVKHSVMSGHVEVDIVGRDASGTEQVMSLHQLSEQVTQRDIKLRFKYFQHIEGEIALPENFDPQRIDVVVHATRPKRTRIEKHYGWAVQET